MSKVILEQINILFWSHQLNICSAQDKSTTFSYNKTLFNFLTDTATTDTNNIEVIQMNMQKTRNNHNKYLETSQIPTLPDQIISGCAFNGRPLTRDDWKFWWAIGIQFNGHTTGEWK